MDDLDTALARARSRSAYERTTPWLVQNPGGFPTSVRAGRIQGPAPDGHVSVGGCGYDRPGKYIRKMTPEDAERLDHLNHEIALLQARKRDLERSAWTRGTRLTDGQVRDYARANKEYGR